MKTFGSRSLIVGGLIVGVLSVTIALNKPDGLELTRNDFTIDYLSLRAQQDGLDPYDFTAALAARTLPPNAVLFDYPIEQRNPHTPLALLSQYPLGFLTYRWARAIQLVVTALGLAFAIALALRQGGTSRARAFAIGAGSLALLVPQDLLDLVQLEGLITAAIVVGWILLRRSRDVTAGVILGAIAAIKLYPLFLLIPLLAHRRAKASAALIASFGVLTIVGMSFVGTGAALTFLRHASPENYVFWRASPLNISLVSLSTRVFTGNPWFRTSIEAPAIAVVSGVAALSLCVAGAWLAARRAPDDGVMRAVPWMILASPLAWEFALSLMTPIVMAWLVEAIRSGKLDPWRMVTAAVLVIGVIPGVLTQTGPATFLRSLPFLALTAALLAWGWRDLRADSPLDQADGRLNATPA